MFINFRLALSSQEKHRAQKNLLSADSGSGGLKLFTVMADDEKEFIHQAFVDASTVIEDIFLSRQPIFDRHERVWGYELLSCIGLSHPDGPLGGIASTRSKFEAEGGLLLEKLAGGKRVLLNLSQEFLLRENSSGLPQEMVALEISSKADRPDGFLDICRSFKEQGHLVVLHDCFGPTGVSLPLVELIDIVKVDYQQASPADWQELAVRFQHLKFLAYRIETRQEFREAVSQGLHYFQGPYYSQPEIIARPDLPRYKLNYVKLLNELSTSNLDFPRFQTLIEGNPPLVHKLLSYINSAFFGRAGRVSSVRQALLLLGEQEIRKWAALAIIPHLGSDQPEELLRLSLLRAHLCEIFAGHMGLGPQSSELFLAGLLSLLDVYLGKPLAEVLSGMPLSPLIKETLLGGATPYRQVFDLVAAIEGAQWERVSSLRERLGLKRGEVLAAYLAAVDHLERAIQSWSQ
jgi:c-di-GMP-related signal transduction protein